MKYNKHNNENTDYGPEPYIVNIDCAAKNNSLYRRTLWTGCNLQVTLMCIPPCSDIGLEIHNDTTQLLCIEQGNGLVIMGDCKDSLSFKQAVCPNDAIFIPAGKWHNLINTGNVPIKLYSVYAPPQHPHGTIHITKADAHKDE